jgi:hypothetical protein
LNNAAHVLFVHYVSYHVLQATTASPTAAQTSAPHQQQQQIHSHLLAQPMTVRCTSHLSRQHSRSWILLQEAQLLLLQEAQLLLLQQQQQHPAAHPIT